ncbi:MAG: kynureninase [Anaerolineae bacterium]
MIMDTSRARAAELDQQDPLAAFRQHFYQPDPDLVYMDGNSLGRLPLTTPERLHQVIQQEWGTQLIRSWNEAGWFTSPQRLGDLLAPLIGAAAGEVAIGDSTTVNFFKLVLAALGLRPDRPKIVSDVFNFPSDLYVLQGVRSLLGNRHNLHLMPSRDGIYMDWETIAESIDSSTALVTLSHVAFKSSFMYDARAVTEYAHQQGALVLWDLSHAAGAVPVALNDWGADFAVGCTYKYLNGGPGAPAFLYVRRELQAQAASPIWGWYGDSRPFAFDLAYAPAPDIRRFVSGTPPVLSLLAIEQGISLLAQAGIAPLRAKSVALTEYMIALADTILAPLGFVLGTPREPAQRGSHISIRHVEGYRINRALIEEMQVVPDFRTPDNLRLGLAPLYTSFTDVWETVERIRRVVVEQRYQHYPTTHTAVT